MVDKLDFLLNSLKKLTDTIIVNFFFNIFKVKINPYHSLPKSFRVIEVIVTSLI